MTRAEYLKHDSYGHPLPDRTKGMIFLRQAKIPGHLEDHIMAKTNGSRNFSDLLEAIQVLARRPMSQTSSSYPSFNDDWTDSTYVTEYYDMDDYHDTEGDGHGGEFNEFEDYDSEWIDMSNIPEDLTFEEPELACILENLQKGRKGSGKFLRKGSKGFSKGEFRDKKSFGKGESRDKENGKGIRPENYKQVRLKLQGDRLNRGWKDQPTRATYKGRNRPHLVHVDDLLTRTRCFKCGELGHLAITCSQKKEDDPSLFAGDKETATESETFFSGMALGHLNVEIVLAEQEELFLHDSDIDEYGDLNSKAVFAEQEVIFCLIQTLTRRKERFCSTQTLM